MALSIVNTVALPTSTGSPSSGTITMPSWSLTAGNTVVLFARCNPISLDATTPVADTAGNTWIPKTIIPGSTFPIVQFFYCYNCKGNANNVVSIKTNGSVNNFESFLWEISGTGTFDPTDVFTGNASGSGTSPTSTPAFSTISANEILLGVVTSNNAAPLNSRTNVITGWTFDANLGNNGSGGGGSPLSQTYHLAISSPLVNSTATMVFGAGGTVSTIELISIYNNHGQVATSTFSPGGGAYSSTQTVSLLNANSAAAGFAMYYTTDGSTPSRSSTLYSGPITVSVTTTIKVLAIATDYQDSAIASATYTISSGGTGSKTWLCANINQSLRGLRK